MATPHVAGAASLVWAQNPTMTYAQVKSRLLTTGGQNPNGTWKSEITDTFGADSGTLNSWSLTLNSVPKELPTVTGANGAYSFTTMTPDTYIVREMLKSGWKLIAPSPNFYSVCLASGAVVNNRNFGNKSVTVANNDQSTDAITASDGSSAETLTGQLANLTQNTTVIPSWQSQIKKLMEIIPGRSLTS